MQSLKVSALVFELFIYYLRRIFRSTSDTTLDQIQTETMNRCAIRRFYPIVPLCVCVRYVIIVIYLIQCVWSSIKVK